MGALRLLVSVGFVASLLGVPRWSVQAAVFDPEQVTVQTLDNGLQVVVKEGSVAPVVVIDAYVRFGSAQETPEKNGIAHALEHMIFQGRDGDRVGRLPRMIEAMGGRVTAETSRDHTHFSVAVSSEHFEQAVTQLAIAVRSPELELQSLSRELAIVTNELMELHDNPLERLLDAAYQQSFGQSGYGLPRGGTIESVRGLTRADLQRAHDEYYTGPNMSVVVVGDVPDEEAHQVVAEAFGAFPNVAPPAPVELDRGFADGKQTPPPTTVPGARPFFLLAFPAPGIEGDKEAVCAADVLMAALSEGRGSRFAVRGEQEDGLLAAASCMYLTQRGPGLFYVWGTAPEDAVDATVEEALSMIRVIRDEGLPEDELARAIDVIVGSYAVQSETFIDQAGTLGFYSCIDSHEFAIQYEELVRDVTSEDIRRVARTYLDPEIYTLVRILPGPVQ